MGKLKAGDRFTCLSNNLRGLVVTTSNNSIYQYEEYVVIWDGWPNRQSCYEIDEVDHLWEIELPKSNSSQTTPNFFDKGYTPIPYGNGYFGQQSEKPILKAEPKGCEHVRKTYTGLFEVYDYCQRCDVKL